MANIKYGRNNGTYTIPVTSDPYANLGAAIGTILGNNYYERGIAKGEGASEKKSDDIINAFTNNGTAQQQNGEFTLQQMYNEMYNDNNGYTPYTLPGTPLGRRRSVPDDLYNQAVSAGAVTLDGNDLSNVNKLTSNVNAANNGITVGSVLPQNSSDYSYNYTDGLKKNNFNGQRDLKAEKLDYIAQKYSGASPNPDGDAITVNSITNKTGAKIADTDFSKLPTLSVALVQSAIRKKLREDGRTSAQINQILENISPELQAKVQQANETKLQGLTSVLNRQINDGDLDNAAVTYARISQISKPFAQALGNKLKLAQDNMTADQKFEYDVNSLMKRNGWDRQTASNYVQFGSVIDPKTAYDIGLANRFSDGTGGTRSYNTSRANGVDADDKKLDAAIKALKEERDLYSEDDPMWEALNNQLKELAAAKRLRGQDGIGYNPQARNQPAQDAQTNGQLSSGKQQAAIGNAPTAAHDITQQELDKANAKAERNLFNQEAADAGLYRDPWFNKLYPTEASSHINAENEEYYQIPQELLDAYNRLKAKYPQFAEYFGY